MCHNDQKHSHTTLTISENEQQPPQQSSIYLAERATIRAKDKTEFWIIGFPQDTNKTK